MFNNKSNFFRTPHDWSMLIFYGYVVWTAPAQAGAGMGLFSVVIFYYLTTQSLSSWRKLLGYLRVWTWLLIIIALFGVLQTVGVDITGGREITEFGRGRPRLAPGRVTMRTRLATPWLPPCR